MPEVLAYTHTHTHTSHTHTHTYLSSKTHEGFGHLVLLLLRLWLHSHLDHRLREVHLLKNHGERRIAERVSSSCVLEADDSNDVAWIRIIKKKSRLLLAACSI